MSKHLLKQTPKNLPKQVSFIQALANLEGCQHGNTKVINDLDKMQANLMFS